MENVFKLDQENIETAVKRLQQELQLDDIQAITAERIIVMGELEKTFRLVNYDLKQMPRAKEEFYRAIEIAQRYKKALQCNKRTAVQTWRERIREIIDSEKIPHITADKAKYLTLETERKYRHKFLGEIRRSNGSLPICEGNIGVSDAAKLLGISTLRIDWLREQEIIPFDIKVIGDGPVYQYQAKFLEDNKQKIYNALIERLGFNQKN